MVADLKCPECGQNVAAAEPFCPNCGHVFQTNDEGANDKNDEKGFSDTVENIRRRSFNRRQNIIRGAIAVAVIAAIVFFVSGLGTKVNDDSLFPDKALQQYLSEKVDVNQNGKIDDNEITSTTHLDGFEGRGIKSLEGLEIFKNLESLDASNAGIEKLFRTYTNKLFTNHEDEELVNLKIMNLSGNNLESISLSDSCPNLEELYCSGGSLKRLSLAKQDELAILDCSHNQFEGDLDISDAGCLKTVNCSFNQIEFLNLPPSITNLNCSDNLLSGIHFDSGYSGGVVTLDSLYCQNNQLVSVVSGSGIAWNSVNMTSPDNCDLSNNPGIRLDQRSDGGWYIDFDELNP
ncbi:MAG: leucine-rich repeat domain-containing protein [Eggerthellaceae bacterium]|nr:leucine-rich repeat domain-containing protein [Eggerthellaceae bacterium]